MALERSYIPVGRRNRHAGEVRHSQPRSAANKILYRSHAWALPLIGGGDAVLPDRLILPTPVILLTSGLILLIGFAIGMTVRRWALRLRERELARGQRLLTTQARGLRQQLAAFYRLRDGAKAGNVPELLPFDDDEQQS